MNYCATCPLITQDSNMWDACYGTDGSCYFLDPVRV